jgi:hypothetical protein
MKKFLVLSLAAFAVACGGDGGDDPKPTTKICTANQAVDCGSVPSEHTGGKSYVAGLGNAVCNAAGTAYDFSSCVEQTLVGEGETCTGSGQGNCSAGLQCFNLGTSLGRRCQDPCDPNTANSCGTGKFCFEASAGDFCQDLVDTGDLCTADEQCVNAPNDICVGTGVIGEDTLLGACTQECAGNQIGGSTGCRGGETCVRNPVFVEVQDTDSDPNNTNPGITCTEANEATTCNTAMGYRCIQLTSGFKCSREAGFCAQGLLPMFGTQTAIGAATEADICAPIPEADGFGLLARGDGKWCGVTGVTSNPALVDCVPVTAEGDAGVCVGACGGENGGADLNCGTGYSCQTPARAEALFYEIENPPTGITCPTAGMQGPCGTGFLCEELTSGLKCAKPSKVCTPN